MAAATSRDATTERLRLLEHVAQCLPCRRDFDLLRTVVDARPRHWWLNPGVPLAAATLLTLVVWNGRRLADPGALRAPEGGLTPYPGATLSDSVHLAWRPVTGAARYQVEMFSLGGQLLATAETRETTLTLPWVSTNREEEARWVVRAYLPDGQTIESPSSSLRRMQ